MSSSDANKLFIWNNSKTMNLPDIMHKSILHSQYFKDLLYVTRIHCFFVCLIVSVLQTKKSRSRAIELKQTDHFLLCWRHFFSASTNSELTDYSEVVQEIVSSVQSLLPTKGLSSNQPSEAICLLYKLFTLKLTRRQIESMLDHRNVFVKAIALLYVRFCVLPKEQWSFYEKFVCSEHKIEYLPKQQMITMGEFTIGIIREQRFLKTVLFPRIPGHILSEMDSQIDDALSKRERSSSASVASSASSGSSSSSSMSSSSSNRGNRRHSPEDRRKRQRSRSPTDSYHRSHKRERSDYYHDHHRHHGGSGGGSRSGGGGDRGRATSSSRDRTPSPPRSPAHSRFGIKPVVERGQVYSDLPQAENPYAIDTAALIGEESRRLNYATTKKKSRQDWRKILAEEDDEDDE